jgi:hypothetical protein
MFVDTSRKPTRASAAWRVFATLLLSLTSLGAFFQCDGPAGPSEDEDGVGYVVGIREGDGQAGPAGQFLANDIVAEIHLNDLYDEDTPRNGTCTFTVESGNGVLADNEGRTGNVVTSQSTAEQIGVTAAGVILCRARWRLGPASGENTLRVTFRLGTEGLPNYLVVRANGYGAPARVVIHAGDGQTAEANTELPVRPAVRVVDASGVGVPGMRVWFIPLDDGEPHAGVVVNTSDASTALGVARMSSAWQLGPAAGTQELTVRVLEGAQGAVNAGLQNNPATFTATAGPRAPRSVERNPLDFPEPQNGYAGKAVELRPSVRVLDAGGYPMEGVIVHFSVGGGGGTFGGTATFLADTTDEDGVATLAEDWILGTQPGALNIVHASVQASSVNDNPVDFTANAIENTLPVVTIVEPLDGSSFEAGTQVQFRGTALDEEDGELGGAALRWTSSVNGYLGIDSSVSRGLTAGTHTIRLTATDAAGDSAWAEVTVSVIETATGSISGRVFVTGLSLSGVRVELTRNGEEIDSRTTNSNGRYTFPDLPPGEYTVTISGYPSYASFSPRSRTVTLPPGENLTVNFSGSYAGGEP